MTTDQGQKVKGQCHVRISSNNAMTRQRIVYQP